MFIESFQQCVGIGDIVTVENKVNYTQIPKKYMQ